MDYHDVLIEDLTKSIIIISHREVYKFITLKFEYTGQDIIQDRDDRESVDVYNLFTNSVENIATIEIVEHIHKNFEDLKDNDKQILEVLNWIKTQIKKYNSINSDNEFSDIELYNLISRQSVLNYKDITQNNYIFEFLFNSKFVLSVDDIFSNDLTENKKEKIIVACKHIIQSRIDEVVSELNDLKNQTEDLEDVSDIDTIIEMYTSIVDEIDFSDCSNIVDFFKKWPPLLLPLPKYIDMFISKVMSGNENLNNYLDFMNIVDNMLTYQEMKELLDELEVLQPKTDQGVIDQRDLTPFKEYLRYKLSNEHK